MAVDAALRTAHEKLLTSYKSFSPSDAKALKSLRTQLAELKLLLAERDLLYPQATGSGAAEQDAWLMARDALEIGALSSVLVKDTSSFDQYWNQLKPFYASLPYVLATHPSHLPASTNYEPIVGLSLLRSLSSNAISEFHMALETLPAELVRDSPFIQHPVLLERWLMEGSYSNVWRERNNVPREEFRVFVDILVVTIRHEIASCEEKAYDTLPLNDVATLMFFDSLPAVLEFAKERGWQVNPTNQTVEFLNKHSKRGTSHDENQIPMRSTITSNLLFARELESIV